MAQGMGEHVVRHVSGLSWVMGMGSVRQSTAAVDLARLDP